LHEEIEELISKNPELGYSSVAELCYTLSSSFPAWLLMIYPYIYFTVIL